MPVATLKPNERYALVGKTRSGKTALAMVIAGTFARTLPYPWEVWWIDTKNDPNDIKALRKWGFRNAVSPQDRSPDTGGLPNALYWIVTSRGANGETLDVVDQCQAIFAQAYDRKYVVVVIDEYVQVCPSKVNAGAALLDIFQRGGGRNVGLIGLTQEPVYVPRQLISQATHLVLLSLSFGYDIDYVRKIYRDYNSPLRMGDNYGFYWGWLDGNGEWGYYADQSKWYKTLQVAKPQTLAADLHVRTNITPGQGH